MSKLSIMPAHVPWLAELRFPREAVDLRVAIKPAPGVWYGPQLQLPPGRWYAPVEMLDVIELTARSLGMTVDSSIAHPTAQADPDFALYVNRRLRMYQRATVLKILQQRAMLLSYDTGMGKTVVAIEAMRLARVTSALIVCPAIARWHWQEHLDQWWPKHPVASLIQTGEQAAAVTTPIIIINYELLSSLSPTTLLDREALIIDESHFIAHKTRGGGDVLRTQAIRQLVTECGSGIADKMRLALTATPISNEPKDLHNQLDTLWPNRVGSWFAYVNRYCNVTSNDYTKWDVRGTNPEHEEELQRRLTSMVHRVSLAEVADEIPPYTVRVDRVPRPKVSLQKAIDLASGEGANAAETSEKIRTALTRASALLKQHDHVVILTYYVKTAELMATALRRAKVPVVMVNGESHPTPRKRLDAIAECAALPTGVLVATMSSVATCIDLGFASQCVFIEISSAPAAVIQAAGRFCGFRAREATTVWMIVLDGSQDEIHASRVQSKLATASKLVMAGGTETRVRQEFDAADEVTFDDWTDIISEVDDGEA